MASLAKISLYLAVLSLFFSQLIKYSFDISLCIAAIINIIHLSSIHQLKIKNKFFLAFIVYAVVNLFFQFLFSSFSLTPILYLTRLAALLSFFIFPPLIDKRLYLLIKTVLFATVIFGFIQYLFFPDLTYFSSLNWDPHLNRIVGPFFDPTFTALLYLFLVIIYFKELNLIAFFVYTALALTYSRASFLTLGLLSIYSTYKTRKIFIVLITFIILIVTMIILPKPYGEGTKLDRTSSIMAKIENYKVALITIKSAPIFGYGFNRLTQIRTDQPPSSHASSGFDSSLLTIWATTGIFGFGLFIAGLVTLLKNQPWQKNLFLIATLIHSLFANSLLYPPILFLLAFL